MNLQFQINQVIRLASSQDQVDYAEILTNFLLYGSVNKQLLGVSQLTKNIEELMKECECSVEVLKLQESVRIRDSKLAELTSGYLKDLQVMREQLYRKEQEGSEFYEVQYFDSFEIGDKKYLDLVNNKISQIVVQCDAKTKYLTQIVKKQKIELTNLTNTVNDLHEKQRHFNNVEFLIRKAFHLEKDPYKLWKYIQDAKGVALFQVFENPKTGYGIDYHEINNSLMVSKVYDRELKVFQESLENQLLGFMQKILADVYEVREKLLSKNSEIESLNKRHLSTIAKHHKQVELVYNSLVQTYNQLLMKLALMLWQKDKEPLPEILKQLSQFKLNTLEPTLSDYLIQDISQLQDKLSLFSQQMQSLKQINKSLELRIQLQEQYLQQIQQILNVKINTLDVQQQKILKLEEVQIRHCTYLLEQLTFNQMTYQQYLSSLQKEDKQIQTDQVNEVSQKIQNKDSMKQSGAEYVADRVEILKLQQQIKELQAQSNKEPKSQHKVVIETREDQSIRITHKKASSRDRPFVGHYLTDNPVQEQPYLHKERSTTLNNTTLPMKSPQQNYSPDRHSNLLKEQLDLPKTMRKQEISNNLRKQLQGLPSLKLADESGLRNKRVIIQYRDFPESERQLIVSPFPNVNEKKFNWAMKNT